jgi:tetratricopeptide (TPR) repeat protein
VRTMQSLFEAHTSNRRLDSWKEIAAFFGRDESTVRRWEKERSLPVHRFPGSSGARVFAFTDELSHWMRNYDCSPPETSPASPSAASSTHQAWAASPTVTPITRLPDHATHPPRAVPVHALRRWIAVVALAALVGVVLLFTYHRKVAATNNQAGTAANNAAAATNTGLKTSSVQVVDSDARDLYLKGRYYWDRRTPDDLNKAVDFFNQAIVRDPNYAQAYVGLADCYNLLREYAAMPAEEAYPRALAAARKAVELDDSSAEAHSSLAFVTLYWNWDIDGAEREFRRALELDPKYVVAHHWYATFLMTIGRLPEALEQIDQAQQLNPASTPILADKALILYHLGHIEQATAMLKRLEVAQPTFFSTHQYLADIYLDGRAYADYLEQARKSAALSHDESQIVVLRAAEQGFKSGGGIEMLRSILGVQKKLYAEGRVQAFSVAITCAYLGDKAETLRYLDFSDRRHEASFPWIRVHQAFAGFHRDPAFRNLVIQAGLPPLP